MLTSREIKMENAKPAPWKLVGNGYVFVFFGSKEFANRAFLSSFQFGNVRLPLSAMMLVEYENSPVGPYFELLYVPGLFRFKSRNSINRFSISKIYVSSQASVENGINNWGIPKELASFEKNVIDGREFWKIYDGEGAIASFELKSRKFKFPISTSFFPLKLAQRLNDDLLLTTSNAKGKGSIASIENAKINSQKFPDVMRQKQIIGMKVEDFKMEFLIPKVFKSYFE